MVETAVQNVAKDPESVRLKTHFTNPRKGRYPGFKKNIYDYFSDFSGKTGIYGLKYIGEQGRSLVEKLYWLLLFSISLYICVSLLIQTWIKWNQPTISFPQTLTPLWKIPFPAITICSETKSRQRVYNFTEYYHKILENLGQEDSQITEEEIQKFADVSLLCDNHLYREGSKTTTFDKSIKFLKEIAPPFAEMFFSCKWTSQNESCDDLFSPILTEDGICYTFNMLNRNKLYTEQVISYGNFLEHGQNSEWTLEDGYPKDARRDTFPRRAMSAGSKAGMFLLLAAYEQDLDYVCRGPVQGFKVLLHHPAEVPSVGTQYFRAPLNQEIVVAVKPEMMTTSGSLRDYNSYRRQCYFSKERHLQFFKSYTQQNCQIECVANFTLRRCGCVAYHMPHDQETEICGSGSNDCLFEAEQELLFDEVESEISRSISEESQNFESSCNCLPACTSITYNAEISQADFNWPKVFEAFRTNFSEFPGIQMTRLTIFFKDMQFVTSQRNELYGRSDFLAHCGGLLGLFTGFSVMSIVEIIYFLTLRLIYNMKKYGVHFWSGSKAPPSSV